jgi:hypothetical protein
MRNTLKDIEDAKKIMYSTLIVSIILDEIEDTNRNIDVKKLREIFVKLPIEKLVEVYNDVSENGFNLNTELNIFY